MPVPANHTPGAVITAADVNALAALANAAQPGSADLTTIAGLSSGTAGALVTDGSGWIRKTYAQLKTALGLVKADVGLGNVDNTADTAKPVSTAQQTALDLKAPLASPAFTGTPTKSGSPVLSQADAAGAYQSVVALGASSGTDDTATVNALLATAAGKIVRGRPGTTYLVSAPLVVQSGTTLDMTGCTVQGIGTNPINLLNNASMTPQRSVTNGAMTATSTTLTSATAAFTSADVNRYVRVMGANASGQVLVARIASVTNGTTVVLDTAAKTTVSGATVYVHDTDYDISVIGGRWDHWPVGTVAVLDTRDHAIVLRYVERFVLNDMTHTSRGGGKYAIQVGAARDGRICGHFMDASPSDGVHITGPAKRIDVRDITGTCDDDMFVITAVEPSIYPYNYNDCIGDVSQVTAENIHKKSGLARIVAIAPGPSGSISDVKVRNVSGTSGFWGVIVQGDRNVAGGTVDDLVLENISTTSSGGYSQVYFESVVCGKVTVDGVWRQETGSSNDLLTLAGTTIKSLVARNLRQEATGTGRLLKMARDAANTESSIDHLLIADVKLALPSATTVIELFTSSVIKDATLRNWYVDAVAANTLLVNLNSATASVTALRLDKVRFKNTAGPTGVIVQTSNGATLTHLSMTDCLLDGGYWPAYLGSVTDFYLSNCRILNNGGIVAVNTGGTVTIWGSGINPASTTVSVASGGSLRSITGDFRCDLSASITAKSKGDRAYNTNAALSCGVGPVVYTGTAWKSLIDGTTY